MYTRDIIREIQRGTLFVFILEFLIALAVVIVLATFPVWYPIHRAYKHIKGE